MSSGVARVAGVAAVLAMAVTAVVLTDPAPAGAARPIDRGCPSGVIAPSGFVDVPGTSVHRRTIDCIVHWGVTRGSSPGRYSPQAPVTRDQMAAFLVRALEAAGARFPAAGNAFADDNGNPHEASIDKLAALGMVNGTGPGRYSPGAPVTRAAMATFLVRAFEISTQRALPLTGDFFGDDNGNGHETNINKAAAAGFADGTGGGGFAPGALVSRDQMASFLARFLDKLVTDGFAAVPPPAAPLPPAGSGPVPVPAAYRVTISGVAGAGSGGTPFALPATIYILPTVDGRNLSGNGVNPVEIGIDTDASPIIGVAGALWFGTNTTLSGLISNSSRIVASAVDVAVVQVDNRAGRVRADVDGNAFGLPTARLNPLNIYNVSNSIVAQVHNVLAGTVELAVSNGGRTIAGTINLGGSSGFGGPTITSFYQATFQGTRAQ